MADIIMPPTTPMKELDGAFYGLSGYGAYAAKGVFNGGLFVNGGFEDGLTGWLEHSAWTAGDNSADNPGTIADEILYQNFTLEEGATYELSAEQLEGDAVVNFLTNDTDSGVDITAGTHTFIGQSVARSIGVYVHTAGTTPLRVTNIRLVKVS